MSLRKKDPNECTSIYYIILKFHSISIDDAQSPRHTSSNMAEVNGVVLLVMILLSLVAVAGLAVFATVEWSGKEVFGIQTFRFKSCTDGVYLLPNGDGTYRIKRDKPDKETFLAHKRPRKERMTSTTQSQTIYVPENASILDAFSQDITAPFEDCHDIADCRPLLLSNNDNMIWLMKKAYRDVASESMGDIRERFEGNSILDQLDVVNDDPVTVQMEGADETVQEMVVGTVDLPLYTGYILVLLVHKLNGRPLPQVVEGEDYLTISNPSSP